MISKLFSRRVPQYVRGLSTTAETVTLRIDGKTVSVPKGTKLVEAIQMAGSNVPTMCYHPDVPTSGGICRICLVESTTAPGRPIISCKTPATEGMDITTQGSKMKEYRQANLAMMLNEHPHSCLSCPSNTKCKTQTNAATMDISQYSISTYNEKKSTGVFDKTYPIHRDADRCINCDICVGTCKMQGVNALGSYNENGHVVHSMGNLDMSECISCGQCINRCPTGALTEMTEINDVLSAINDPKKTVVFQMAPAVRVALAEEFGYKPGTKILKNEIATALRKLGPNVVPLDTNFSADLTIIEEGHELIERLYRNVTGRSLLVKDRMPIDLPMFTSCCPGWIIFMEKNYPDMLNHLSTCKSPQQMLGALIKGYWAKNVKKVDPKNVVSVSIMPCSAKKEEKEKVTMKSDEGYRTVDHILTTRELAKMLKLSNIDPSKLKPTPFDKVMSEGTGAAVIFGVTGGVMEAALRTAYEVITGREIPFENLDVLPVRGMEGIREAEIKLENVLEKFKPFEGVTIKVAIAHGPNNARKILEIVKQAKAAGKPAPWHFVEVMACPGGCIGGGGQPKPTNLEIRQARTKLTFEEDMNLPHRKSHENSEIIALYRDYLKEPLGHNSHHYLHTKYIPNPVRNPVLYNADEARGLDYILSKYPKEKQYLLPIIIAEHDAKGYISDPSLMKIANYLGMFPAEIDSILSAYHYFPRKYTSNNHVYFCTCHNCMMKGQARVMRAVEEKYGLNNLHNSATRDGKLTFHTLNWLGYCVNHAPAMMVKRTGTDFVEVMTGLSTNTIEERLDSIGSGKLKLEKYPQNNIRELSTKRYGRGYSILESNISLSEAVKRAERMGSERVIQQVLASELVGRGGAGFHTGLKWESAFKASSKDKYVVCNADEGLPSTYKDWTILKQEYKRRELIAGMGICANVIGAKKCYIYVRYEYRNLEPALQKAIKEVKIMCPEISSLEFEVRLGGGPYVAGEENALFESIQGAAPIPRRDRLATIFPTEDGLFHKPTVINNVETFLTIPHIIYEGAETVAGGKFPKLLSITGDIDVPTIMESNLKNYSLNQLLNELHCQDIIGAEVGGATEPLIFRDSFDIPFGFGKGTLNAVGSIVLFNSACDFSEIYESKLRFMADESCKQCVPCRDGSKLFYRVFKELKETGRTKQNMHVLDIASESVAKSSICAHGKATGTLFKSACDFIKSRKPKH